MAHVMSLISFPMSIGFMSHVEFKKRQCRPVEFRGQGPQRRLTEAMRGPTRSAELCEGLLEWAYCARGRGPGHGPDQRGYSSDLRRKPSPSPPGERRQRSVAGGFYSYQRALDP